MERDGKTWHWCPHHYKEGLFDGLYMPHKPCDHDAWVEDKKAKAAKRKNKKQGGKSDKNNKSKSELTDSMKQALVAQGNMSEDEATALRNSVINAQGN